MIQEFFEYLQFPKNQVSKMNHLIKSIFEAAAFGRRECQWFC